MPHPCFEKVAHEHLYELIKSGLMPNSLSSAKLWQPGAKKE